MEKVNILNDYLACIAHKRGIKNQFISGKHLFRDNGIEDPLNEKRFTKAKGLIHRYPDRVVLTVTNKCFAYCNFCFRKNNWINFNGFDLNASLNYLSKNKQIREVLISGGDPLTLTNQKLKILIESISQIDHIKTIRIGTRVLSSYPIRIEKDLINIIKGYKPVWFIIHVNHPAEITSEFINASKLLIENGIPILSQTVLLRKINDNAKILKDLFCKLVNLRIKPYYLFGCDMAKGNETYRVPISKALNIIERLRNNISGLCMPFFALDLPEGGGKLILEPDRVVEKKYNVYRFKSFEGRIVQYEDAGYQ